MSGGTKKEKKVRAVPNPYLATAAGWDDLPFDNQLMMRRRVNDELVRDWRERVVFSRFAGFIAGRTARRCGRTSRIGIVRKMR